MQDELTGPAVGAVALAGSGEYTAAMRATDAALLATCATTPARVVVCPAAAGKEPPASPARWARMGIEHFRALGAAVEAAMILNRADAEDPRWLPMLEAADFYYFSGGDPGYLTATLVDTPVWQVIRRRYLAGAVLAGCSAGAMALGGWLVGRPGLGHAVYQSALGILPQIVTLPHFDQWGRFIGSQVARSAPSGTVVVGIDEDTALLRVGRAESNSGPGLWEVQGRQTVTVFDERNGHKPTVYKAGEHVPLPFA